MTVYYVDATVTVRTVVRASSSAEARSHLRQVFEHVVDDVKEFNATVTRTPL